MKKILSILFVATFVLTLTGCGGSKTKKPKGDGYIYSYDETDIFDKYETKKISQLAKHIEKCLGCSDYSQSELDELDKYLSYKEIKIQDENNHWDVYFIIYNDSDTSYDLDLSTHIAPHSAVIKGESCWELSDCYEDTIAIVDRGNDNIGNNDFEYRKYEKDLEGKYIKIYFTYNREGNNMSELNLYCVKDGTITGDYYSNFIWSDDGNGWYNDTEVSKKGQKAIVLNDYYGDYPDCDSFVYFIEGYFTD